MCHCLSSALRKWVHVWPRGIRPCLHWADQWERQPPHLQQTTVQHQPSWKHTSWHLAAPNPGECRKSMMHFRPPAAKNGWFYAAFFQFAIFDWHHLNEGYCVEVYFLKSSLMKLRYWPSCAGERFNRVAEFNVTPTSNNEGLIKCKKCRLAQLRIFFFLNLLSAMSNGHSQSNVGLNKGMKKELSIDLNACLYLFISILLQSTSLHLLCCCKD